MSDQLKEIIKKYDLKYRSGIHLSRERSYLYPRQYFCWHLYKKGYTFEAIGGMFSQDHTTARHAYIEVQKMIDTKNMEFLQMTNSIAHDMMNIPVKLNSHPAKKIKPILFDLKERINAIRDMEDVEGLKAFINEFY